MSAKAPPKKKFEWSLRSRALRGVLYQILALTAIGLVLWFLAHNTVENMRVRGIRSGYDFFGEPAGFDIGESIIPFDASRPYWQAFLVGLMNTLRVASAGIVLATILGALLGIGRFANNAIVRGLCYGYVELFRNVPLLLQLFVWYVLLTEALPDSSAPVTLGGLFFLSKSGLGFPAPVWAAGHAWALSGALLGIVAALAYSRHARRAFERTGMPRATVPPGLGLIVGMGVAGWALGGAPGQWRVPALGGYIGVTGGGEVSAEFMALLLGLVFYTSAFIAETVRAGIQSVVLGQSEAGAALGLSRGQLMRLVILPQALRVIIPPLTNNYLSLTKNSSLAVAIGYPDLVSVANTALNQTGRAIECITVIMAVYLALSLATSAFMNWYNLRAAIKER